MKLRTPKERKNRIQTHIAFVAPLMDLGADKEDWTLRVNHHDILEDFMLSLTIYSQAFRFHLPCSIMYVSCLQSMHRSQTRLNQASLLETLPCIHHHGGKTMNERFQVNIRQCNIRFQDPDPTK